MFYPLFQLQNPVSTFAFVLSFILVTKPCIIVSTFAFVLSFISVTKPYINLRFCFILYFSYKTLYQPSLLFYPLFQLKNPVSTFAFVLSFISVTKPCINLRFCFILYFSYKNPVSLYQPSLLFYPLFQLQNPVSTFAFVLSFISVTEPCINLRFCFILYFCYKTLYQPSLLFYPLFQLQNPVSTFAFVLSFISVTKPCINLCFCFILYFSYKTLYQPLLLFYPLFQLENSVSTFALKKPIFADRWWTVGLKMSTTGPLNALFDYCHIYPYQIHSHA